MVPHNHRYSGGGSSEAATSSVHIKSEVFSKIIVGPEPVFTHRLRIATHSRFLPGGPGLGFEQNPSEIRSGQNYQEQIWNATFLLWGATCLCFRQGDRAAKTSEDGVERQI